ncbi:MAG: NADH-quinone oxidoreductase subunit J [Akkermansiaceae bacterium]|nr:NADH-quinone oxidoreductase subunit J [Akkermansiaceae bacterium]
MENVLFYLFATLMIGSGLGVVVNRNPVASALCLVVSFIGLAALFIQLDAYLIGILQVLVYAGAVMVLFLFIIMLLDVRYEERKRFNLPAVGAGILIALLVGGQIVTVVSTLDQSLVEKPALDFQAAAAERSSRLGDKADGDFILSRFQPGRESLPDTHLIGETLFTRFNLHLQVVGVLLLVATLGVVVLSKRKLR